jgi:hypothetical protein
MGTGGILRVTRGTKVIFAITFSVSACAIIVAFLYYRGVNRSEDPRIETARLQLLKFEKEGSTINAIDAFHYLDSANSVFNSLPDYKTSYERGVIYNNKCSALLLKAIYDSTITGMEKGTLLRLSFSYNDSSITVYRNWIREWGDLSEGEIREKIAPYMRVEDKAFSGLNFDNLFQRRVKNLVLAQTETPRRLSVSLSNRGTLYRHLAEPDSALHYFTLALSLWKENRTAKSNLSVLMGGDPVKATIIESLFPPDKNKK